MELQDSCVFSATTVLLYVSRNTSLRQMMEKKFCVYLFVWLCQVLVAAHRIFSCSVQILSCSMWDQVPDQGLNSGPLYWKQEVCTTGPVGKSPMKLFLK